MDRPLERVAIMRAYFEQQARPVRGASRVAALTVSFLAVKRFVTISNVDIAMDVCSPKDGFVVKLLVNDHDTVNAGTPLFVMDIDDEGRTRNRLMRLDEVRGQLTSQYEGIELSTSRQIAQLSVSIAQDLVKLANEQKTDVGQRFMVSQAFPIDVRAAESKLNQANFALKKAQLELATFDFAIKRHITVSAIIKSLLGNEIDVSTTKQARMTVISPIPGKLTFHMAVNSFAKLGRPVASVG